MDKPCKFPGCLDAADDDGYCPRHKMQAPDVAACGEGAPEPTAYASLWESPPKASADYSAAVETIKEQSRKALRDRLAVSIVSGGLQDQRASLHPQEYASRAYRLADAMLAVRELEPSDLLPVRSARDDLALRMAVMEVLASAQHFGSEAALVATRGKVPTDHEKIAKLVGLCLCLVTNGAASSVTDGNVGRMDRLFKMLDAWLRAEPLYENGFHVPDPAGPMPRAISFIDAADPRPSSRRGASGGPAADDYRRGKSGS